MKVHVLASAFVASLCVAVSALGVDTFTVDIVRTDGGGSLGAGDSFTYEIRGTLTNQNNEGLAFFALNLQVVGPSAINLGDAISQSGGPDMATFEQPLGYSVDFTGTPVGDDLIQAGGGQNTIDNDPDQPPNVPFPSGDPVAGIGHGAGTVLFEGTLTIPEGTADGDYTLQIMPDSLFANVLDGPLVDGPDPVVAVATSIGSAVTFSVQSDTIAPQLVHEAAEGPASSPCSGYIDPRFDSDNGADANLCFTKRDGSAFVPEEIVMVFSEQVRDAGSGPGGALTADAFTVLETGGGSAPGIASVSDEMNGDAHVVTITLDRPITVQEWTTVVANVEDLAGNPIASSGDQGPGVLEPDRIDIACLPGDINQSGNTSPVDNARAQQQILGTCAEGNCPQCSGILRHYDIDRSGSFTPVDLARLQQLLLHTGNSSRRWNGQRLNNDQP